jgi:hypothetical protein
VDARRAAKRIFAAHLANELTGFGRNSGTTGSLGRDFQVQKRRNALRCQAMTVSGRTITSAERQVNQTVASVAQSNRSDGVSLGRLTERCRTPS